MNKDWRDSAMIGLPIASIIIIGFLTIKLPQSNKVTSTNTKSSSSSNTSRVSNNRNSTANPAPKSTSLNQNSNYRISPEQAVIEQYSLINKKQYQKAWNRLSPQLRNNRDIFTQGYNSYANWWKTVKRVEIKNTKLVTIYEDKASVNAKLTYYMQNGASTSESRYVYLVWDNQAKQWLVTKTSRS